MNREILFISHKQAQLNARQKEEKSLLHAKKGIINASNEEAVSKKRSETEDAESINQ